MKLLLLLCLASISAISSTDPSAVEGSVEASIDTVSKNPIKFNFKSTLNTNQHSIQSGSWQPDGKILLNQIGASKKFDLGSFAQFEVETTPNFSVGTTTEEGKVNSDDSLYNLNATNALKLSAKKGNIEYGITADMGYKKGFTYRMRNYLDGDINQAYRRDTTHAMAGLGLFGDILINKNYKIGTSASVTYRNYFNAYYPERPARAARDEAAGTLPETRQDLFIGKEYDHVSYRGGMNHQIIGNKLLTVSFPINFELRDFSELNAFGADWIPTTGISKRYIYSAGISSQLKLNPVTLKGGFSLGRYDEQNGGSDSNFKTERITASAGLSAALTKSITFNFDYSLDIWDYDNDPREFDEKYDTYSTTVNIAKPFALPFDTTLGFEVATGTWGYPYNNTAGSVAFDFTL